MKTAKRMNIAAPLLVLLMLIILLSACTTGGNTPAPGGEQPAPTASAAPEATPEVKEVDYPASISYWASLHSSITATMSNLNEVAVYKELEKITGTKVDFRHPSGSSSAEVLEQFNLMLASRNLPDVIENNWLTVAGGPENAIRQGTIIRLNELIDEHAPNLKRFLDENPDIEKMIKTDEGSIYTFPFIREDEVLMVFNGTMMRKDWLDKLGLAVPATIEEWETVLTAFRDRDPNGNGEADEVPYLLNLTNARHPARNEMIGAWGISAGFYQVNGQVKYGEIQPEYKDFLTTMHRWYKEKLIDPDFAAVNNQLRDAKMTNNQLGSMFGAAGGNLGTYMNLMADKNPEFRLVAVPHPALNKGDIPPLGQKDVAFSGLGAAISGVAKNPESIVKWLDYAYSEEGKLLFNFGIEGESYEIVDGSPKYADFLYDHPDGLPLGTALAQYVRAVNGGPFIQDKRYISQFYAYEEQKDALQIWRSAKNEVLMPGTTLTEEESKRLASIMGDANTYAMEMVTKFIMGAESLDQFDKFVSTMQSFGIEEAVGIQQAALDRYNSR